MSLWQRYVFGMMSGAGSVVIKTGLNIVLIPIMLAHLGLESFGLFILLVGVLEVAALLDLGLVTALIQVLTRQDMAQQDKSRDTFPDYPEAACSNPSRGSYLTVGHGLFLAMAVLFLLGGFLLAPWFDNLFHIPLPLRADAPLALMLVVLEAAMMIYSCYYQAVLLAHCANQWTNLADTLYSLVSVAGALILVMMGFHLPEIFAVRLLAAGLRLLMMAYHAGRLEAGVFRVGIFGFKKTAFSFPALREMAQLGWHGMMINLSIIVSHKVDVIVIGLFLPLGAIGVYELVFRFLGIAIQICLKMTEGSFPMFSRMAALDEKTEARQLFLRMSAFLLLVAGSISMLVLSFYPELLGIFAAGKVTLAQTEMLPAVAVPIILSGVLQMPAGRWLFAWGHQRYLTTSSVLAAVSNLVLSLILVQWLGLLGVALGTLIPQLIQHQAGLIRTTCRSLSISFRQYLQAVYGGVVLPIGVAWLWIQFARSVLFADSTGILAIGLMSAVAMVIAATLWFLLTAPAGERKMLLNIWVQQRQGNTMARSVGHG